MAIMQLFTHVHLFSLSRVDGALFHKLVSTKQYIAYSIIKKKYFLAVH